jgi:pimeloyl-ACP methyl ester carboxylesterase
VIFRSGRDPVYLELDWARSDAETIVLLHGMGSCGEDWLLQRAELRGRYHLICLDLPGHGHSRQLSGWPSLASLSQAVRQAVERWAPTRPVHLVGLSLGAAVGLQVLVDDPPLIRSAVLVNGFGSGLLAGRGLRHALQRGVLIATGRMDATGPEGIWSIGLDGSEPRLIHQAYRPRDPLLSPGGAWIAFHQAFTGDSGQNGLWILRTDGSALSKITPFGAYRWRSDGRLLLIPLSMDMAPAIFEVDAAGGRAAQITDPALTSLPIANGEWFVSPDGSLVAFTSWVDRAIWVLTLPD